MKQIQTMVEKGEHLEMVSYAVPDEWEPSPDWPVLATMLMPMDDNTLATGLAAVDSLGALVEVDGEIVSLPQPEEG